MDHLQELTRAALPTVVALFMVGNLAAIGLELDVHSAMAPLRDPQFVGLVMLWDWVLCPGAAWLLAELVPMDGSYGLGLVLIGMAPAAPFLPMMVRRAHGDLAAAAAFMLVGVVGTVVFMPLALPVLAPGFAIATWAIARPLLVLVLLPLMAALAIRTAAPAVADRLQRPVKLIGNLATVALLIVVTILYKDGFVAAVGSYAIGTQLLFAVGSVIGAYMLGARLPAAQRRTLTLGVCTRNLGAAMAPLLEVESDPRTTVMVALAVPITLLVAFVSARWLDSRRNSVEDTALGRSR